MKQFFLLLMSVMMSATLFAQNGGGADLDVNITKNNGGGSIPWLWIIGGIIVLVLLIVLLGRGRNKVVEKRTVIKD